LIEKPERPETCLEAFEDVVQLILCQVKAQRRQLCAQRIAAAVLACARMRSPHCKIQEQMHRSTKASKSNMTNCSMMFVANKGAAPERYSNGHVQKSEGKIEVKCTI
jgi:hypothetical protein